jgi:REP element-mobilizing transposase RayT
MAPPENELGVTRRHLPHLTRAGATYFVTVRLRAKPLTSAEIGLVRNQLLDGDARYYKLIAVQIMPDHFHAVLRPRPGFSLRRVVKGIKGVTARLLNQHRRSKGQLWQDESYDRVIRDQQELEEKLKYMFLNPVKAGVTAAPESYVGWYRKQG